MANDAEKKNIAKLDFYVEDAKNSLTEIDKKLEKLAQSSEAYAKKIGQNINGAIKINVNNMIDTGDVQKKFQTITGHTNEFGKKMKYTLSGTVDFSKMIDVKKFKEDFNKLESIGVAGAKKITITQLNENAKVAANRKKQLDNVDAAEKVANARILTSESKTADQIKVIKENVTAYKEKRAADAALAQEKANLRVLNSTKTLYDKITEYAKTYIIYQGFNELKRGVKETIEEMVEMEYQMVQIDRVLNDNSLNIDIYRDKLIQMAQDYANSFENVADITLRLAQAGYNADESLALTEKTLLALNTAELDATQATDDMVAVMAQWGLMTGTASEQAENYGSIIDKINKVADNFPTTSADILDALKKTSSAFNLAGASIDETIATIVAAEKASQRGGKVIGTALSNIIQQLKAEKKLDLAEELGLNFFKDAKKTEFRPVMEIFQEMSEMMQNLKDQGKESSVEMQGLLEMFTVFRRNIGASLLSEMAGEDSTYAEVLKTSLDSVGYSLQENSKHMQTAKAAQAQFNAELLKLKTQVWEGGLEDVFRDMLSLGTGLTEGIGGLIDKFGLLPVSVAAVTLAFTLLNKNTQASNWVGLKAKIEEVNVELNKTTISAKGLNTALKGTNAGFQNYVKSLDKGKASMMGYLGYQTKTTAQTILLTAKTILLQAVISGGITLAISALVGAINNWIKAEEKAIEAHTELMEKSKENAKNLEGEISSIQELRKQYEELSKKDNRTAEENQKIYEIQEKLNQLIGETGQQVELVTKKVDEQGKEVTEVNNQYDVQLQKIKEIEREKEKARVSELRLAAEEAQELLKGVNGSDFAGTIWEKLLDTTQIDKVTNKIHELGLSVTDLNKNLASDKSFLGKPLVYSVTDLDFEEQFKFFVNARTELQKAKKEGKDVSEALNIVNNVLDSFEKQTSNANNAIQEYNEALKDMYDISGLLVDYQAVLTAIMDTYGQNESVKNLTNELTSLNNQFANGKITTQEYFDGIKAKIDTIDFSEKTGEELEGLQAIFAETTRFIAQSLEDIQNSFDDGEITFKNYVESLADANENLLELYATQNNLKINNEGVWEGANQEAVEYANNLQAIQDQAESFIGVLQTLGESYDYIAENADAYGNAAFEVGDIVDRRYQTLATNFSNSLAQMRIDNEAAWTQITQHIFDNAGKQANEIADVDAYVANALKTNNNNLNIALNEAAKQSQEAASKLATNTGDLISALGDVIANFKYNIKFNVKGSIDPGGNILNLATGKSFKPTSDLTLSISGSAEEGSSVANLASKLKDWGTSYKDYTASKSNFNSLLETISPYVSKNTAPTSSGRTNNSGSSGSKKSSGSKGGSKGSGSKGGSGGGSSSDDRSEYYAQREAEEAYKKRLKAFEDYIDNKEEDEENWVKRQKELNQLSNQDFLYITQQRIERYKKYLEEVKKATWMNEEDKLALQREYSEKIKDLEIDYLGYLQDQLDEEIEALEKANQEKIDLIEKEADARIEALDKVSEATDRARAKEDYESERQSILEEISYWEQRTGREAQEALVEARKKLAELDAEWEDTQEDWSVEDQIKKIEEERDAEIAAIEAAQEAEIKAMQDVYDAKVKMFVETGEIIYEGSVIQAQSLYNAYKKNFIDPISTELQNLNKAATTQTPAQTQTQTQTQQYETYLIKSGDTLSKIAKRYGTTVEKLMAANPYITNKNRIYAGKTLQIPKFHEGGIVGGTQEAFALLKPHEVILKPEWAAGINKLAKMAKTGDVSIGGRSTVVEVKGDLVRIDAKINDKTDAEYLTRRIEKMLKDKFNIKK